VCLPLTSHLEMFFPLATFGSFWRDWELLPWLSKVGVVPSLTCCPPMEEGLIAETLAEAGKETKRGLCVCQDIHSKQLAGLSGAPLC